MKKKMISTVIAAAALSATLMFGVNSGAGSGWLGETVMAAENDYNGRMVGGGNSRRVNDIEQQSELMSADEGGDGVYDFKDNKTTGTITVTKEWSDKRTNSERPEPEIKISTKKPSKSTLGYTVTFHGNEDSGLAFADGSYVNEVVYN